MVLLSQIFEFIANNWIIVAFLAPMSWALVNVIDVYFVDGIYDDELDGTIISGIFQIMPWFVILPIVNTHMSDYIKLGFSQAGSSLLNFSINFNPALLLSFAGGLLFSLSFYFYFKALFHRNDVALVEILTNLCVVAVPLMSFFLFHERLSFLSYFGMGITLSGALVLSFSSAIRNNGSKILYVTMLLSVIFLSVSMIFESKAYSMLESSGISESTGFWAGFLFFSLGVFTCSFVFAIINKRNPFPLIKKYSRIFLIAESISFSGTLFSQRALDISPSSSYVATIETFVPVFVLLYSLIVVGYASIFFRHPNKKFILTKIYREQFIGVPFKFAAIVVMGLGVYVLSS
ncbi:hypothetical protein A2Y83_02475 [Candidatus Falkowbacteria bacterium RBG_13_39_14]|uniref:EamA domain-containing protein n=1 Tax=Candidatus Falkowbacteria bacterium RBG_13_39_14 TaxID=1797985 RepID=A0A1F5S8F6_9BACT|nr:MAG: hypothetical protein A2Y83_02475 [Candidatus Falkowbacteria bacterium RBG_13_39_14]